MHNAKIGARVRAMREARGLDRLELARRAQVAPEFLASVEDQGAIPALGRLVKLARALGVRLGAFTDDAPGEDPCIVRASRRDAAHPGHTGGEKPGRMAYHSLGRGKADRHMEPFFIELAPGGPVEEPSAHEGEEFIIVVRGRVRLVYGRETCVLEPGDSAYYNSVVPHLVACEDDAPAAIHAVVYVPF